jgi:hypothetical protein
MVSQNEAIGQIWVSTQKVRETALEKSQRVLLCGFLSEVAG